MVKLEVSNILNQISALMKNESVVRIDKLNTLVSAIVGMIIGSRLNIPSSEVKSPRMYYINNHTQTVNNYVNEINESYVLDIDAALKSAYTTWKMRYSIVYPKYTSHSKLIDAIFSGAAISSSDEFSFTDKQLGDMLEVSDISKNDLGTKLDSLVIQLMKQLDSNKENASE